MTNIRGRDRKEDVGDDCHTDSRASGCSSVATATPTRTSPPPSPSPSHFTTHIVHDTNTTVHVDNSPVLDTRGLPSFSDVLVALVFFSGTILVMAIESFITALLDFNNTWSLPSRVQTPPTPESVAHKTEADSISAEEEDPPSSLAHMDPPHSSGTSFDCTRATRWYVVFVGKKVGVFNDWFICTAASCRSVVTLHLHRSEVQNATIGVPGNCQCRYANASVAVAAFNAALASGTVCRVDVDGKDISVQPFVVHTMCSHI